MAVETPIRRFRCWHWLIRAAGVIVPRRLRADWRQEWEAELHYRETLLAEWDRLDWRSKVDLLRRSLGAFWDALLLQPQRWEDEMIQDLRFGVRMLVKHKGLTLIAVLTLALGIGANTAIFSVVNAVLLRPLPYQNPAQLMTVWEVFPQQGNLQNPIAPANFTAWRDQNSSFEALEHHTAAAAASLTNAGEPEKVNTVYTSDGLLQLLGVQPELGRIFQRGEITQPDSLSVIVISHKLWQRRFGGDAAVVGKQIRLDDSPVTIIGVMPDSFTYPANDTDVWAATQLPPQIPGTPQAHYLLALGRLKPGVSAKQAQADLDGIAARLGAQYPQTNKYIGVGVKPLSELITGDIRRPLLLLLAATAVVLLIACVNVANLLLARAVTRQKEIAIRLSLGAGRGRLILQLMTESSLLALFGGVGGLLLAIWGTPVLAAFAPPDIVQARTASVDLQVLLFTLGISLLTAMLFGLIPAWQATKPNLNQSLKEGGNSLSGASGGWTRSLLVVSEIALAMVLLVGGGLLVKSFSRLSAVHPGFRTNQLLTLNVLPPYAKYPNTEKRAAFYDELLQRVENLPGVESAGVVTALPAKSDLLEMTWITEQREAVKIVPAVPLSISASYFRTMEMPLIAGRDFNAQDAANTQGVVIINEAMARAAWPYERPIGKRMKMGLMTQPWLTVAGVVKDARLRLEANPKPQVYLPYTQTAAFGPGDLVLQTKSDPTALVAAVRHEVWAMDKDQPIADVQTMERLLADSIQRPRFNTLLVAIFGLQALLLAVIGIFGVMSYAVTQNRREIGVRMALGAQATDVLKLVVKQGMVLVLIGIAAGLAASLALTKVMKSLLFEVTATDPLTFSGMAALFAAVAFVACYLPAKRATRIDPLKVLRHE